MSGGGPTGSGGGGGGGSSGLPRYLVDTGETFTIAVGELNFVPYEMFVYGDIDCAGEMWILDIFGEGE